MVGACGRAAAVLLHAFERSHWYLLSNDRDSCCVIRLPLKSAGWKSVGSSARGTCLRVVRRAGVRWLERLKGVMSGEKPGAMVHMQISTSRPRRVLVSGSCAMIGALGAPTIESAYAQGGRRSDQK